MSGNRMDQVPPALRQKIESSGLDRAWPSPSGTSAFAVGPLAYGLFTESDVVQLHEWNEVRAISFPTPFAMRMEVKEGTIENFVLQRRDIREEIIGAIPAVHRERLGLRVGTTGITTPQSSGNSNKSKLDVHHSNQGSGLLWRLLLGGLAIQLVGVVLWLGGINGSDSDAAFITLIGASLLLAGTIACSVGVVGFGVMLGVAAGNQSRE